MSELNVITLDENPGGLGQMGRAVLSNKKSKSQELPNVALRRNNQQIDPNHVGQYASVCGFEKLSHVPITYPHMLAFGLHMEMMLRSDFPFSVMGLVHVSNSATQIAPLSYTDMLDVQCRFAPLKDHDKGKVITIITEIFRDNEVVWKSESAMLKRMNMGTEDNKKDAPKATPICQEHQKWSLASNLGRQYASVSGDRNPIHLYGITAKLFGFKQQIIHGMWTKARCAAALDNEIGEKPATLAVDFKLPIFLPGKINFYHQANDKGYDLEVWDKQGEKPHLKGTLAFD